MANYKSIFISDVHLGTRGCQAEKLLDFLKNNTCENLFLIGDIFDGWRLSKRWYFPQSHANVVRKVLTLSKDNVRVYYILGNHDEYLRKFLQYDLSVGKIKVMNHYSYNAVNGKKYLVTHGDLFDKLMLQNKWLMHIGDTLYNLLIWLNTHFNRIRKVFGMRYWSLSKFLKGQTKQALNFINNYEKHLADYCDKKGYDGVICGHIHTPAIKQIGSIEYMNDGDWVESCSALIETHEGNFELVYVK